MYFPKVCFEKISGLSLGEDFIGPKLAWLPYLPSFRRFLYCWQESPDVQCFPNEVGAVGAVINKQRW